MLRPYGKPYFLTITITNILDIIIAFDYTI